MSAPALTFVVLGWLHRDALNLKSRPKQQRARTNKRSRGKLAIKVRPVDRIELIEEGNVRAEHLHKNQIRHPQIPLRERFAQRVQHQSRFLLRTCGRFLRRRVQANMPAHVERIAGEHAIRKRQRAISRRRRNAN